MNGKNEEFRTSADNSEFRNFWINSPDPDDDYDEFEETESWGHQSLSNNKWDEWAEKQEEKEFKLTVLDMIRFGKTEELENVFQKCGYSPSGEYLLAALSGGFYSIADLLIQYGVRTRTLLSDVMDFSEYSAKIFSDEKKTDFLLKRGADPNFFNVWWQMSPLIFALCIAIGAKRENESVVKMLNNCGARAITRHPATLFQNLFDENKMRRMTEIVQKYGIVFEKHE